MSRHDEDGDLAGTNPADALGPDAALIARLYSPGYGLTSNLYREAADRIKALTDAQSATDRIRRIADRSNAHERKAVNTSSGRDYAAWERNRLIDQVKTLEAWREAATVNYRKMEATLAAAPHADYCETVTEIWDNESQSSVMQGGECTCWKADYDEHMVKCVERPDIEAVGE